MTIGHDLTELSWADLYPPGTRRPVPNRWTDPQRAFLESTLYLTVLWGGNSIGKSLVLGELARRALRGELPWQTPGQPYTVILTGNTWTQLGSTLKYLFDGIEPGEFRKGIRYEGGRVKGQRLAVFEVVGGPGKGGELRCGTFRASNLAGPRADVVLSDEPLPSDVHSELLPRLLSRSGRMYITFTPTLGTAGKIGYLWHLVDDLDIPWAGEVRAELTIANCTPRGGLIEVPFVTQSEIDRLTQGVSKIQVEMRLGRSRVPRTDVGYFSGAWGSHLRQDWTPPKGTLAAVGIDHGSRPGAQRASLTLVSRRSLAARIHVADHARLEGRSETRQDAKQILAMLERNQGLLGVKNIREALEAVDLWIGDRSHAGSTKWGGIKSNLRLQEAIARELGIQVDGRKRYEWREDLPGHLADFKTPRKYDGSVWDGCDELLTAMIDGRFTLSKRSTCDQLDQDFCDWTAGQTEPAKDGIDCVRYPAVRMTSESFAA